MAVCTLEGWGVSRQRRKAAKWMRMAAKAGDGQAAVLLSTLQSPLVANQARHSAPFLKAANFLLDPFAPLHHLSLVDSPQTIRNLSPSLIS